MLRDKSLIPLSHQHQHALALCVRVDRANPVSVDDLEAWQKEIERLFAQEIEIHFSAEENLVFPAARGYPELNVLIEELVADHAVLRDFFSQAQERRLSAKQLAALAQRLSEHIRKEERDLFEQLQKLMKPSDLETLGAQLEGVLKDATRSCNIRSEATQLRPGNRRLPD